VAGPVQRERRGVQQPDHDIRAELEHGRPRDQHIVRGGDDRRRQLQSGAGRGAGGLRAGQDTLLLAGANDLWKCSLALGCAWRNTTNSTSCMSAQVGEYQHALAWNTANPLEVFVGNDSGLWRSTDAVGESGQVCSAADSSHFQNLNGSLGRWPRW